MQRYKPGSLIRNKQTGKPLLVLHVYRIATIVIDPSERGLAQTRTLLERDYPNWVPEEEMENTENTDDITNPMPVFRVHHISL